MFKRRKMEDVRPNPRKRRINISIPELEPTNLPNRVVRSTTPQDLVYHILTGEKKNYTKHEVLLIIAKVDEMLAPKFSNECSYIN